MSTPSSLRTVLQFPEVHVLDGTQVRPGEDRPWVTIKYAQTLDGRIATSTGHSRWISGPEARVLAHQLRAEHHAVLVGIGTILADDPQLTVRLCSGRDPVKVIVDSQLRIPVTAAALSSGSALTIIATTPAASRTRRLALEAAGAQILQVSPADGQVDLQALFYELRTLGITSLLAEGGAGVITSLLRRRLADRVVVVIAPKLIGAGLEAVGDLGIRQADAALTFGDQAFEMVGQDIVFRGSIRWPPDK